MYEAFYQLKDKPFSLLPDPAYLYLGEDHGLAIAMLEYGLLENHGYVVLTGPIGSGKTTLLRHLLDTLDKDATVGFVANTHSGFGSLLEQMLAAFQIDDVESSEPAVQHQRFVDYLLSNYAAGKHTVLIIDEAQNVPASELEQLRLISNINSEKDLLLNVILVGQPELQRTIAEPGMVQFAQRISVFHELKPLNREEVRHYIAKRLKIAGATEFLFTAGAMDAVMRGSEGIPRLINRICESALVYGYAASSEKISTAIVNEVISDQRRAGLLLHDERVVGLDKTAVAGPWFAQEPDSEAASQALAQAVLGD